MKNALFLCIGLPFCFASLVAPQDDVPSKYPPPEPFAAFPHNPELRKGFEGYLETLDGNAREETSFSSPQEDYVVRELYRVNESDSAVVRLKKQRIVAASRALLARQELLLAGREPFEFVAKAVLRKLNAMYDFHENREDRIRVLQEMLVVAQQLEAAMYESRWSGKVASHDMAEASSLRLDVELRLAEEQASEPEK